MTNACTFASLLRSLLPILTLAITACTTTQRNWVHLDAEVFKAVRKAVLDQCDTMTGYPYGVVVATQPGGRGTVTTDWVLLHKGEIQIKVEAAVVGNRYIVKVRQGSWGKINLERTENEIVKRVERLLKERKRNR